MNSVFLDPHLEVLFRKNGYVKIPFYDSNKMETLKSELNDLQPDDSFKGNQETKIGKQSFHITFFDKNIDYKKSVLAKARSFLDQFATTILNEYKCAQANIFLKLPGSGYVYPHQNITIVDETFYTSISIWIPLQDTTLRNGAICLIPGSQNYFEDFRNTHVYWPYVGFFKEGPGKNYFKTIDVKAGEVLVLDDRIVHYTPNNYSEEERWVFHSLWKPSVAELYFFDPKEDQVNAFLVEEEFWQFNPPGEMIDNKLPDKIIPAKSTKKYTEAELLNLLEKLHTSAHDQ